MYLKSIEVNGFKSFANKIIFEFPHGITGIVGPNGSGKSNIGDAVRWGLGEQSAKQLRGSRMEDVIFSGTENRKPLGFAYVAILFDNSDRKIALDYDEVKVARRVYRSGESECLLNGSACRRRDIVEIFYDTGIGKEGYSIIGQGQVEKILSGKIEDSRELFDEAAGIAKYKKNRAVTEKSLEQERQNLERVTDVLSELEGRVGPLEEQSKKAKEYLKLKEKAKNLDTHLFLYDYEAMEKELSENERQSVIIGKDLEETKTAYEKIKQKNNLLQEKTENLAGQVEKTERSREELQTEKEALDSQMLFLQHKMDSNERMILHYEEIIAQNHAEKEKKQAQSDKQKEQRKETEEKISVLEKEKEQREKEKDALVQKKQVVTRKIALQKDALFSMMDDQLDTKEKLSRYDTMEEQLQIRNAEYNSRLIALQLDLKEYNQKATALEKDLEEAQTSYEEALSFLEQEEYRVRRQEEEEKALRLQYEQDNQQYLRFRSRYETLAAVTERYDGYNQSIKHIMEQKKKNLGIVGVVADILELDQEYETAIEIALGGALQNIVTEDDQVAKKMIAWLKQNRYGRATFLPLTNIRRRNANIHPSVLEEEGVIGIASALVKVEPRYESLVEFLLGRTIVVDTVENALRLSKRNNYSLRMVTVGGELLNPGGSITGGAFRHSGNLLGRKRETEESRELMEKAAASCKKIKENLQNLLREKAVATESMQEQQEKVSALELKLHDLGHQIPDLMDKEEEIKGTIGKLKEEHKILQKQLTDIRAEKEVLSESQLRHEKIHEKNNGMMDNLEREEKEIAQMVRELEQQINQIILQISQAEQQKSFLTKEVERLQKEMDADINNIAANKAQQKELKQQNEEARESRKSLAEQSKAYGEKMKTVQEQYGQLKEEQKKVSGEQQVIIQELEEKNERLLLLEKEKTKLLARKEKLENDLETRVDYMWENYEITYNYAREIRRYEIKPADAAICRQEKKEVAHAIRQLGNVNINAIEEYQEVGERYEFLRGQYEDIKEAEAHLLEMIEELNQAMEEQFTESFQEIRQMFAHVFKDLFEGGTADLELMEKDNMLECGIRIVAQPPGKKLQNILLLSGGERALTAIALLFAIQKLKPSPFCLLDEIEAALDDANIVRFSKYLRRLSEDTQFIVITHRRGTMNAAEALYGITMQEKGVSTLISVDLIDKDLEE